MRRIDFGKQNKCLQLVSSMTHLDYIFNRASISGPMTALEDQFATGR